jgi:aspartokinase/homoserine dehydrogenase 1
MSSAPWTVHKFGGTSLADPAGFRNAARRLAAEGGARTAAVVSAPSGVTDALIDAVGRAARQDPGYPARLRSLESRVRGLAERLLGGDRANEAAMALSKDVADLLDVLRGVSLTRVYAEETLELVAGYGELWSARLLHAHLLAEGRDAACLDAREVLVVEPGEIGPSVEWEPTVERFEAWRRRHPSPHLVITGYIASNRDGIPTTLKRNGSDFSASIFGALLHADAITIWTDVDGVLTADPRRVPEARVLPRLSYNEAMELAYFGAKVLHPHTMAPAIREGIPIRIRNTFRPEAPGTLIHRRETPAGAVGVRAAVKGFSSVEPVALVNVEGSGMIGVPGIAHRLFGSLREAGISVIMISQASSEHSICFAVPESQADRARRAVEEGFFAEIHHGQVQTVDVVRPCSIVAAVGDDMVRTTGVAARFFGALGKAGVNVRAVAQGSSERNISVVVDAADSTRALRALHAGFYLSDQTLSVGLLGPGSIGSALLRQIQAQRDLLRERFAIDLRVRGIMNSRAMIMDETGLDLSRWEEELADRGTFPDLNAFVHHIHGGHLPHAVMIDCTASGSVPALYEDWLSRGMHVITPNKKAGSAYYLSYRRLRELGRKLNTHYLYEATVGAGLPVITTLRDLLQTGDRVISIEGVLSGTLSFLFNELGPSRPFSELVREAKRRGYTEPNPRDDLSGIDVARKAVILAREMGAELELDQVPVESLAPDPADSVEAFLDALPARDAELERLRSEAEAAGEVLRYVAVIGGDGTASVGLRRYPADHPFARIRGTDNILAFRTERYDDQPLIVQGPGAGPAVTAGGVFADLLRLASYLGAPS